MNSLFQILTLAWSIEGGAIPSVDVSGDARNVYRISPMYYGEYGFTLSYPIFDGQKGEDGIYIGTSIRNEFVKSNSMLQMAPLQDTYTFRSGIIWKELTVGFEHICTHSVENLVAGKIISQKIFGSADTLFVRLSGKI